MQIYSWSQDLEVGNELIDRQHRELFSRLERLAQALLMDRGKSEIPELLDFLSMYVGVHFGDEEQLMRAHDYPGYDEQKASHLIFRSEVQRWQQRDVTSALTVEVIDKTSRLFRGHIKIMDKKLALFLKGSKEIGTAKHAGRGLHTATPNS
ncbi:MAG: bacteriohemerythrin [Thermodesulfobacteriota bacterium]